MRRRCPSPLSQAHCTPQTPRSNHDETRLHKDWKVLCRVVGGKGTIRTERTLIRGVETGTVTPSTQRKSRSILSHVVLTELADVERLREEWHSLFISSRERNAFLHPTWVLTWARHFV